jgi:LytS/YehU family sensor histidine kinase
LRPLYKVNQNPFTKISSIALTSALFGGAICWIFSLIWFRVSRENFSWLPVFKSSSFSALAVVVFTLIYEILFLTKERQLDEEVVSQLDIERSRAEMTVLNQQLEPHFIFNSLNALSYLILHDAQTAHAFNSKLASVYKYFLINKNRELISLQEELEFINNYFFLLQIRHDHKLTMTTNLDKEQEDNIMILPCALQLLVENAIKHNEFNDENPLLINIFQQNGYITIKNNKKPKPYLVNSTNIGLRNLSARYKFVCNKDISIQSSDHEFIVMLPLINKTQPHA